MNWESEHASDLNTCMDMDVSKHEGATLKLQGKAMQSGMQLSCCSHLEDACAGACAILQSASCDHLCRTVAKVLYRIHSVQTSDH